MNQLPQKTEVAVFGGGCFWCLEAVFQELRGVISVLPGYAGGTVPNPTYEQVCAGKTSHAEVVQVEFDPFRISYHDLLTVFFASHDSTTLNRQGSDVGAQYRSLILYTTDDQKREAEQRIKELGESRPGPAPVVTELKPLEKFYEAEEYHRKYYLKNPHQAYCRLVINPKLIKLKERHAQLLRSGSEHKHP